MSINKDQVKGRVEEVKGTIQEVAGRIVGNHTEEAKGIVRKNVGAAQAKLGDLKKDIDDSTKKA